jgi:hypothetical protein
MNKIMLFQEARIGGLIENFPLGIIYLKDGLLRS